MSQPGFYRPTRFPEGGLAQSSLRKVRDHEKSGLPQGLKCRGIVIATYFVNDQAALATAVQIFVGITNRNPSGAPVPVRQVPLIHCYCDVLIYAGLPGMRKAYLRQVLVRQDGGGVHTGEMWLPRPSTINLTDGNFTLAGGLDGALQRINPGDLDGDHVLVEFLDADAHNPVVTGAVPHPSRDKGSEKKTGLGAGGTRLSRPTPGQLYLPKLAKHNGVVHGIDENGSYVINLARAHKGEYDSQGQEGRLPGDPADAADIDLPSDGSAGNFEIFLRADQTASINVLTDPANPTAPATKVASLRIVDGQCAFVVENSTDPAAEPSQISVSDNFILLRAKKNSPGLLTLADNFFQASLEGHIAKLTIDPNQITLQSPDDTGTVQVQAQTADLSTTKVLLGQGAAHPVIWGDTYNLAHAQLDQQLAAFFTQFASALAGLVSALVGPPPAASAPQIVAALTAFTSALLSPPAAGGAAVAAAITAFDTAATAALSPDVVTR